MLDKKFIEKLQAKYQKTTEGNWYVKTSHGMGETHHTILTDKPTAMSGKHIGSFGEFGESNAAFCAFCHEHVYKLLDLMEQCRLIEQWHQRGIMGEPNRALWIKDQPIPEGWIVEDRIPEVDGFVPIKKIEKYEIKK